MKKNLIFIIGKRLLISFLVLFIFISFLFFLIRISPGDPTQKLISPNLTPAVHETIKESFGLNEPLIIQYLNFTKNMFTGQFGISYDYKMPVTEVIFKFLPFTLFLGALSFIIQIVASFFLAYRSFQKRGSLLDRLLNKTSLVVYVTPVFVLGLFLVYIFSVQLNLLPTSGISSIDSYKYSFFENLGDYIIHLIMPLITLSAAGTALFYRYLRENFEDLQNKTFIMNLRSMGIKENTIFWRHIIPNSINPLISVAGIELGTLLGGALITEVLFSLPGMGRLTITAIFARDYPLIIGCSFIAGTLMIIANLAADIVRSILNPRFSTDFLK
jgi:peptide/nickel transport system permease protein